MMANHRIKRDRIIKRKNNHTWAMVSNITVRNFQCHSDDRGELFVAEYPNDIPFLVRRIYYITGVDNPDIKRGFHAHKQLRQVMMCLGGSCDIIIDDGKEREKISLDNPGKAIIIEPGIWREMINFSNNATLMVLASDNYDECDYIRNYDDFLKFIKGEDL